MGDNGMGIVFLNPWQFFAVGLNIQKITFQV